MKQVKLIDVAKEAGVSISTVSQYMSGRYNHMSQNTKEKIERVIEELNYLPNSIARSLKTDKTNTIGVIVFSINGYFTSNVVRGIDDYCKKHDYNVLIYNTDYDPEIEKKSINILKMLRVDGIIIASTGHNNQMIEEENKNGIPIVQMYMEFDDLDISTVISDYKTAAYEATEYLINLGHKNIALITQEYKDSRSRLDRILGYKEALANHNVPVEEDMIYIWDRKADINTIFDQICSRPKLPTAIFTLHASITTGLLRYLNRHEYRVPEDFSIVGFDQVPSADLFKTPVTIMRQSSYEIGEKSAELLLSKICNSEEIVNKKIILPCEFQIRNSCKNI